MNFLVAVLVFAYAVVNAFGAWAVVRRRGWVAALFMLAATVLTVAAVALAYGVPEGPWLVLAGAALASAMSFVNAAVILGRVLWRAHALRAAAGVAVTIAAFLVVR